jgi:hypothetical protein
MLAPIETMWRGYRFRSRTEARWAVMFSKAGIAFEYEPDGYALPSGWYLPDFWLPDVGYYLEIKGVSPTLHEQRLAVELALHTKRSVAFAIGPPSPDDEWLFPEPSIDERGELVLGTTALWNQLCDAAKGSVADGVHAARAERFDGRPIAAPPTTRLRDKHRHRWY